MEVFVKNYEQRKKIENENIIHESNGVQIVK